MMRDLSKIARVSAAAVVAAAGVFFVIAGLGKIVDPAPFLRALARHGVLSLRSEAAVAVLGVGEVVMGLGVVIGLLCDRVRPFALVSMGALLAGLTGYLAVVWMQRGGYLDCGCSGILPLNVAGSAVRNSVFCAACAVLLWVDLRSSKQKG